jgi:hypothetical protein
MVKWIHRLLEPHCPDCKEEREENKICQSCETLRVQLEIANYEKKQLMDALLKPRQPEEPTRLIVPPEQLAPRNIPWRVRQQMLEAEDRKQAQLNREAEEKAKRSAEASELKKAMDLKRGQSGGLSVTIGGETTSQSIDNLEKELGIEEAG